LGAAVYGTTIVVAIQPEKSLDFLLGGVATIANTTGQVLEVIANQIRGLEQHDLEALLNKQVEWLGPYFQEGDDSPPHGSGQVNTLAIGPPPPLLPKIIH
jgi:hypothetical protein